VRRIAVTGASGFIGRLVIPALIDAGYAVRALTRRPVPPPAPPSELVVVPDFTLAIDWRSNLAGCDAVIHLGGLAHGKENDEAFDIVNRRATVQLAHAAAATGVKHFIFLSSIRAQSGPSANRILTETNVPRPTDAYGRSKLAAEMAVRSSGVPFTIFRPVVVYGPGVKGNLHVLTRVALSPWPLPLAAFHNRRSMLAIGNLISAVRFALDTPAILGETYVLSDDMPISVSELISILRRNLGRKPGLFSVPPKLFEMTLSVLGQQELWQRLGGELIVSAAKLRMAGWKPTVDTASGLQALTHGPHRRGRL
jgi:UDP-glucose 4-epimerase